MNPEVQILSEYIDGELPQDLRGLVEERLRKDATFQASYEKLIVLRSSLRAGKSLGLPALTDQAIATAQTRVWERIERSISRKTPGLHWLVKAREFFRMSVSLPIPALAAMAVVVLTIGVVAIARGPGNLPAIAADQNANLNISASNNIPSSVAASGIPVSTGDSAMVLPTPGTIQGTSNGVSVTIEVQNIRQLLNLLEGSQGIGDVTIQLPQLQPVDDVGDPVLLRSSEVDRGKP